MPDPTRAQIHVDGPLSDIAIAYKNEEYIAEQIFPTVKVKKQSDLYFIWTAGFWFRNMVERRTPGDTYPEGRLQLSDENYNCYLYHLGYPIADEDVANEDEAVELEQTGSEWLADQFMLNRELDVADTVFAADVWGTTATAPADFTEWADFDNSNPVTDVNTAKQVIQLATGKRPNTLVLGQEVFDTLQEHPIMLEKYKYTTIGILDEEQIRNAFKVEKLIIGGAVYESTAEGGAGTRAYIWGKNAWIGYVPPAPGKRVAAAGYTFVWELSDSGGYTVAVRNTREDNRDRNLLKGKHAFDHKIVGSDLGYYFSGVIT